MGFPFSILSPNLGNKWSSWSYYSCALACFCRLHISSLPQRNIITPISILHYLRCLCDLRAVGGALWLYFLTEFISLCLFHSASMSNLPVIPRVSFTCHFCIPVPYNKKDIFFVLVLEGLVFIELFNCASSAYCQDLDCCIIEWLSLETIYIILSCFETASGTISDFFCNDECFK